MTTEPNNLGGPPGPGAPGELLPRLAARLIDAIVVAVVGAPLGFMLDFNFVWLALQAALVFGYFVALDAYYGTTLGKQLLGLKVTGPDGGKPTVAQAAVREAFTLLGAIPIVGGVLAAIAWIAIAVTIHGSAFNQGKHDELAGGTRVVRA